MTVRKKKTRSHTKKIDTSQAVDADRNREDQVRFWPVFNGPIDVYQAGFCIAKIDHRVHVCGIEWILYFAYTHERETKRYSRSFSTYVDARQYVIDIASQIEEWTDE